MIPSIFWIASLYKDGAAFGIPGEKRTSISIYHEAFEYVKNLRSLMVVWKSSNKFSYWSLCWTNIWSNRIQPIFVTSTKIGLAYSENVFASNKINHVTVTVTFNNIIRQIIRRIIDLILVLGLSILLAPKNCSKFRTETKMFIVAGVNTVRLRCDVWFILE